MKPDTETWLLLIARIHAGDPLPPESRAWLVELLELVRRGEDPREFAGTRPKRGSPSRIARLPGLHYWALRAKHGKGSEASVRAEIMQAWEMSSGQVGEIARRCKPLRAGLEKMTPEKLEEVLAGIEAERTEK